MRSAPLKRWLVAAGSAAVTLLVALRFLPDRPVSLVRYVETDQTNLQFVERAPAAAGAESGLVRLPLDGGRIGLFYPGVARGMVFDPTALKTIDPYEDNWVDFAQHPQGKWRRRINSLGMRDKEVAPVKPELRVVVVGDSHVEGVCNNHESFPNRLEQLLHKRHPEREVEVLNAARGGWAPYNYLQAFETYAALEPDLFVVTVYGGNDFAGQLALHHVLRGEPPLARDERLDEGLNRLKENGLPSQFYRQVAYFAAHPEEEETALEMAGMVAELLVRLGRERGVQLLFVYLPPVPDVQPGTCAAELERARDLLGLPPEAEAVSERLADAWLSGLRVAGGSPIDLREAFAGRDEPLYWAEDLHLNLRGQMLAAEQLLPVVERLLGLERP